MQIEENFEALESLFVELDPLEDGFVGVLLEIYRHGDRYVLLEMASSTGNQLLRFSSNYREQVCIRRFTRELGGAPP